MKKNRIIRIIVRAFVFVLKNKILPVESFLFGFLGFFLRFIFHQNRLGSIIDPRFIDGVKPSLILKSDKNKQQ